MLKIEKLDGGFDLGEWEILPAQGVLRRAGEEVRPEPKVFAVLLALAQRDGNVVSKDELIEEVWEGKAFSDEPILRCISLLRGHFHDKKPFEYVETLQRRGYRLLKPVILHVDKTAADDPSGNAESARPILWKIVPAAIALGFIAVAVLTWMPRGEPAVRSLAILPCANLSSDAANQYIVEGVKNTLARRLTELREFTIKNVRAAQEGEAVDVATLLDVESLLNCSVEIHAGTVRVGYEIVRGNDGVSMLAGEETGALPNLFAVQERLAYAVRDELAGSRTPALISLAEPDSAAYNSYMRGMYALEHRFEKQNLEESIRLFQESIEQDESYGPAYLGLAMSLALMPDYRELDWQEHLDMALATIEKGVALDPTLADPASAIDGFVHYQRKEWTLAEADYKRAINARVVDSNAFSWYSQMLAAVGRLRTARDVALAGTVVNPDSTVVNSRVAMVYTWLNDTARADEYFSRASDLDATGIIHDLAYALYLIRTGQLEMSRNVAYSAAKTLGASTVWIDPLYRALADPAYAEEGLAAINQSWAARDVLPHVVILGRAMLGDVDGAMEIAWLLEEPGETFSMELLYIDELAAMRQHPDFMRLLESLGVTAYWQDAGCYWENDRVHCD